MKRGGLKSPSVLASSAVVVTSFLVFASQQNTKSVEALSTPSFLNRSTHSLLVAANRPATTLAAEKRPGNPFSTLIGDMASSIASTVTGAGNASGDLSSLDAKLDSLVSTSWEDIRKDLESKQTAEEKAFRSNVEKGIGPASPLNKIRLFDESNKEEDIRVTFYRDSASWCP